MPGWPGAAGFERWAGKRTGNYGQFRGLRQPSGTAGSGAVNAPDPAVAAPRRTGLLRSTAVFSAMTFLSRISGLVRDQVYAAVFGPGPALDAFVVAVRVPNFLRRQSAEGSFSLAFVGSEEGRVGKEGV